MQFISNSKKAQRSDVHGYTLHGKNIILDVNSGSIHVVDPLAFDIIMNWDNTSQNADIQALIDAGKLFSPEIEMRYFTPSVAARHLPQGGDPDDSRKLEDVAKGSPSGELAMPTALTEGVSIVKAMCLHIAHTCNLTCDYCFANVGKYHGPEALMSFEVGKAALDFLIENSGTRRNLEVDFFGGEPLLNWQVVKGLVAYAREKEKAAGKNFRFTLTTNGVLIDDDVIDFCNREMTNIVLSLDGRKHVHDKLRKTVHGQGSYDIVVPKFQEFVKKRGEKNYYMRGTFTRANTDFVQDVLHMAELGFKELSMEPVVCNPESSHALTPEELQKVMLEYETLALAMTKSDFTFYHYTLDLKHGPCFHKRVAGCGVGTEYLAVTPSGDFYPCHQFVGTPAFAMGNVYEGITRPDLREDFASCNLHAKAECRDCWAKYFCAGGCPANAYHASGSIHGLYEDGCELFKKRMECAIWLYATKELGG